MYQTFRGIPGFNFRTSVVYSDRNFKSLVGSYIQPNRRAMRSQCNNPN